MIIIRSSADMARALASLTDATLAFLLSERRDQLLEHDCVDLGELAHFVIAETGDSLTEIEGAAGVAIATNLVDGKRYGEPGFSDNFEFVISHAGGWFEAVIILSDDGFGLALFVPDRPGVDPDLLSLLKDRN